ncbi:MAG: PQQ-binding-like beta-propeller repeat protein [Thermoplasmata archaeon]
MKAGKKYLTLLISGAMIVTLITGGILGSQRETNSKKGELADVDTNSLSDGPWPSFGLDARNTGLSPYNSDHVDGTINWTYETDKWLWSSPAIGSEGIMYFGSPDKKLYALNTEDGTEKWTFKTDGEIISSPAVSEDETIYFGTENNKLYAVDSEGDLKWDYTTDGEIYSSPNLDDEGNIYFGSKDNSLYSLDQSGNLNWKAELDSWVWASPAISEDNTVYVGSGQGTLYAIDSEDGTEIWNYSTEESIYSSPTVDEDGTVYFGSYDETLYALNQDGSMKWKYDLGSKIHPSPAIGKDGTVYIGSHDGVLSAVKEGELKWSFETSDRISSSAAISSDGVIYIGSEDGSFYALDLEGNEIWSYDTNDQEVGTAEIGPYQSEGAVYSSPAIGEDGRVFINSFNGNVYSFTGSDMHMDIWKEVEMSVRIAGRKGNNLSAALTDEGGDIGSVRIEREPGMPQEENMTFKYRNESFYNLTLTYENEYTGANPVWITFNSGDRTSTIFELFHHGDGDEQVIEYNLTEEIGDMMSRVKEVHFSAARDTKNGAASFYTWEFGDGETGEGRTTSHVYGAHGKYKVNLTVDFESGESVKLESTLIIGRSDLWTDVWEFFQNIPKKDHRSRGREHTPTPV